MNNETNLCSSVDMHRKAQACAGLAVGTGRAAGTRNTTLPEWVRNFFTRLQQHRAAQ